MDKLKYKYEQLSRNDSKLCAFYMRHAAFIEAYLTLTCSKILSCECCSDYRTRACALMVKLIDKLDLSVFQLPQYQLMCAHLENLFILGFIAGDAVAQCLYAEFSEKIQLKGFDTKVCSEGLIKSVMVWNNKERCLELMRSCGIRAWRELVHEGYAQITRLLAEYYACYGRTNKFRS